MRKHLLTACLLFSAISIFAQSNFVPARVVKTGGEKLTGLIDYQQWTTNPRKISFKASEQAEVIVFTPESVERFEITGGDSYVSAWVSKDMRPVKVADINLLTSDIVEQENAFLRELFSNERIGLYIITDFKNHFYVRESSGKFVELIYKFKMVVNSDQIEEQPVFRNQLAIYFPELKGNDMLVAVKYNESSLTRFFYRATNTPQKATATFKPVFRIGAGVALSKLKFSGATKLKDHDIDLSVRPLIYGGVDLPMRRNRGALTLRTFAEFYQLNYESFYARQTAPGEDETYHLSMNNLKIAFGTVYNIYNGQLNKFYLGGHVAAHFVSYKENSFVRKDRNLGDVREELLYKFEKSWFTVNADLGGILYKNFELSVSARLIGSFSNIRNINVKPSQYLARVGYRLYR